MAPTALAWLDVLQDAFGNYVVQYVLELGQVEASQVRHQALLQVEASQVSCQVSLLGVTALAR